MVDSFLKYLQFEKRYSPKTVISYRTDLTQFQAFLLAEFEENKTENGEHGMIRSWIIKMSDDGMDSRSINRKIACLRSYFKFLLRERVITQNPMLKIKILKTKKKLPQFVQEAEMTSILDHQLFDESHEGIRDQLILELLYGTGIRLSELISLKDRHVNLRDRTIKVLGKRNKERVIPFGHSLVSIIEAYRKVRNKSTEIKDKDFLIVTDDGRQLYPMFVTRRVKKYLSLSSSEKKSPHVLRHSYATHLLNKGAEINAVKELLGHASLAATQVYTHNSVEKLKKAFEQAHPKA